MVARVFTDLLAKGVRSGMVPNRTREARTWFRREARKTRDTSAEDVMRESTDRYRNLVHPGHCYLFAYDPKWKKELKYYDSFPIIFPFHREKGRFKGFNMHYLPYAQRAVLMDTMYELVNNSKYDESTKLTLAYGALKSLAKWKYFRPTIHEYLIPHVRSKLVKIDPADWDTAIFLPIHSFQKASADQVWRDSRAAMGLKKSRRPSRDRIGR